MTRRAEIVGCGLFEVFPDDPNNPAATGVRNWRASLERVLEHGVADPMAVQKYDIRRPAEEGGGFEERYWSPVNSPVFGPGHAIQYIMHRVEDVTEYVRLRRQEIEQDKVTQELRLRAAGMEAEIFQRGAELQEKNRELELASRAKDQFLSHMSHELRTPLHTVLGFSELLAEETAGPLNEKQHRFVKNIHGDSLHLLELINDILDLSKIAAGKLELRREAINVGEAIENAVSSVQARYLAKSITLEAHASAALVLEADRIRFKQILYNLLSNAEKFTPEGGRVQVTAALRDGRVEVSVADSGIGIPKREQAFLFDKFYQVGKTANGIGEGTGLGLEITKRLVEQHGGRIWMTSEPACGSCFTFTMPLAGRFYEKSVGGGR